MTMHTYYISINPRFYGSGCTEDDAAYYGRALRDELEARYGDRVRFIIGEGCHDFKDSELRDKVVRDVYANLAEHCF